MATFTGIQVFHKKWSTPVIFLVQAATFLCQCFDTADRKKLGRVIGSLYILKCHVIHLMLLKPEHTVSKPPTPSCQFYLTLKPKHCSVYS